MKINNVYHWGGWSRNYGDLAIQQSMMDLFSKTVEDKNINFLPINSDVSYDGQVPKLDRNHIELINDTGCGLIVGAGGQIMYREGEQALSGWQFNVSMEDLEKLKVPLIVYAIGYNSFPYNEPSMSIDTIKHLRATRSKASYFSVRNTGTQKKLLDLDIKNVGITPDPAMFLESRPIELPNLNQGSFKIGLCWAGDRLGNRYKKPAKKITTELCYVLNRFLDSIGGGTVVYIPHVSGYDVEQAGLFADSLAGRFYDVSQQLPALYPESLMSVRFLADIYKQMDMVVGARAHSNIIPFGQNTPFIAFGDHIKNKFFINDMGGYRIPSDCNNAKETLEYVYLNRKDIKKDMFQKKIAFSAKSMNSNKEVCKLLGF